jgi:hypothetical protein
MKPNEYGKADGNGRQLEEGKSKVRSQIEKVKGSTSLRFGGARPPTRLIFGRNCWRSRFQFCNLTFYF